MREQRTEREQFTEKYYPETPSQRERSESAYTLLHEVNQARLTLERKTVTGQENIPSGPFLIIANHEPGSSTWLIAAFEEFIRIIIGRTVNQDLRSPLIRTLLKLPGTLPIRESLDFLTEEEQQQALANTTTDQERAAYEEVLRHPPSPQELREDLNTIVACLMQRDPVAIYPQGLFIYGLENRPASGGYVLIAKLYQQITGQPLSVLPVEITDTGVTIRPPVTLSDIPPYNPQSHVGRSRYYGQEAIKLIKG